MIEPYYSEGGITIYCGDAREVLPQLDRFDVAILDPSYKETSLDWDTGWNDAEWLPLLKVDTFWCFGSLRFFMAHRFEGWKLAQDVVWEKHNGSNFHADRFKRVHEIAAQFYREDIQWADIYKAPVFTNDATARTVRRKTRPTHTGHIENSAYLSFDGGPRLQRSVIPVRSCHGYAVHETQKPVGIIAPLLEYSCPPGGSVIDPTMGSGTTLVAAKHAGRRAVGIDIREKCCEAAANRLHEALCFAEATE